MTLLKRLRDVNALPDNELVEQLGGRRERGITMRTIAERAGVNISTVSRALRAGESLDDLKGVGPDVAARIRAIAAEVGYRPDPNAASLKTRRTRVVGVLVPQLTDVVLATIYQGIDEYATDHGYQAVVANTNDQLDEQRRRTDLLLGRRVDGLILGDAHVDGTFLRELHATGVSFVLVNRRADDYPSATCDDLAGGRLAAQHLAELGHRNIGIVAGLPWASTGIDRTTGCRDWLAEHGLPVPDEYVVNSTFHPTGGREAAERLFELDPRPTAIFAVNDNTAIGVMGAARAHGLHVGKDVAVVGFNDMDTARELPVPLTSVRNPLNLMGRTAAEMLFSTLAGEPVESVQLAPELIVRDSTAPRAGAGTR